MPGIQTHPLIALLAAACSCLASGVVAAAAPPAVENSYRVEMILFAFNDPDNFNQEMWPQNPPPPVATNALDLFNGQQAPGFKVLPPSEYALTGAARRLQASGRYTVLAHVAWEQPGLSIDQAVPIEIDAGRDYAPLYPALMAPRYVNQNGQTVEIPAPQHLYRLSGTVKVVLSRYLHVYTDLVLNVPTQNLPGPNNQNQLIEDTAVIDNPQAQPAPGGTLTEVHIVEHRRTRSRKLNYMDNPMLGILFEIWPVGDSR
ncbi:CsiV family protein [Acidihalobacter aeolianus]|uniref:CsiV family protein n=1 Tax=Acidihalobacter aeolianus TaxID=2792603 RepID=UPI0012E9DF2D|nr:CsiV family protein [Acidihalobacter aeolianus]